MTNIQLVRKPATDGKMEKFQTLVDTLTLTLKEKGYIKSSLSFYQEGIDFIKMVEIQKSRDSKVDSVKFTINLGVNYPAIKFKSSIERGKKLLIEECQWNSRIGHLLDSPYDIWWDVNAETNIELLSYEISSMLEKYVIPQMALVDSEEKIIEYWLSNKNMGLTKEQMYLNLLFLLKKHNMSSYLQTVMDELLDTVKNKPSKAFVMLKLDDLGLLN